MMTTHSNRHQVQTFIETELGCLDPLNFGSYRTQLENYSLQGGKLVEFQTALKADAAANYSKGLLSLGEAILGLHVGRYSWSVIKLYYANFYFLRTRIYLNKYGLLRNNGALYLLRARANETPTKLIQPKKYAGDHGAVIKIQMDHFSSSDILLGNNINGINVYDWLKDKREEVNYRAKNFSDPKNMGLTRQISPRKRSIELKKNISIYLNDPNFIYCFLEDHMCLAVPLVNAYFAVSECRNNGISPLSASIRSHIEKIIPFDYSNINRFKLIMTGR